MVLISSAAQRPRSSTKSCCPNALRLRKATTTSYREAWRKLVEIRKPMFYLDERFRYPSSPSVPTLHYGLGYTVEGIMDCAHKHRLIPSRPGDKQPLTKEQLRLRFPQIVAKVMEYLESKVNTRLFLRSTTAPGYVEIISLYSNHTRHMFYKPNAEREILNFIRRELKVPKQQAAWYWDSNRHGVDYVCEYDEYNW